MRAAFDTALKLTVKIFPIAKKTPASMLEIEIVFEVVPGSKVTVPEVKL